ncbi:MAG: carboxypeptidase M32 [Clostridiales bacterium]|nr:carboxypeptidase M32 [Clostridiales bacterium]
MDLQQAVKQLDDLELKFYAFNHAQQCLCYDAMTAAPKGSFEGRGKALSVLSGETHKLLANETTGSLLVFLNENKDKLDFVTRRRVEGMLEKYRKLSRIPLQEYMDYNELLNEADAVWHEAKENSDFERFAPVLTKVVEYNRRFAGYYDASKEPYDALLNEYEKGTSMEELDRFFEKVKETVVPLLAEIRKQPSIDNSFLFQDCSIAAQRIFSDYLMEVLGIDRKYCNIGETEHPFTDNANKYDVRITTHYHEDSMASSMYSVIHEGGHALYELHGWDELQYTCMAGGVSMGIHESQSRFYENIIGRSLPFIRKIYPKIQELFPEQFKSHTAEEFYRAVNKAEPSLIRIEADELTYSLHIMVRYEIEKQLIRGTLEVKDLPAEWNRLYKEYLGIDVPDDKNGCLQDSHWSGGMIGYFPSYALGSAYGAQMLHEMEKEDEIRNQLEQGDLSGAGEWLSEHIHQHGCLYTPAELMEKACGGFDPSYFTDYLEKKYRSLYNLR